MDDYYEGDANSNAEGGRGGKYKILITNIYK